MTDAQDQPNPPAPEEHEQFEEGAEPVAVPNEDSELESIRQERDEFKDKHLRALADLQNFRRRADLSVQQAREGQLMDIGKALAGVMDHFDRALEIVPEQATVTSVLQGLKIVHDELLSTLQRFGIERVDAAPGDVFDPSRHEAMMRQKVEGIEPNHVGSQFQPGYMLGDKTIRAAKVTVTE